MFLLFVEPNLVQKVTNVPWHHSKLNIHIVVHTQTQKCHVNFGVVFYYEETSQQATSPAKKKAQQLETGSRS
jgi:hypothetical protein